MGRGEGELCSPAATRRNSAQANRVRLSPLAEPPAIGSEAYRRAKENYCRSRTGRRDIRLSFHEEATSYTDMHGNLGITTAVPPDGSDAEKEIVINHHMRHEMCHEDYTDQATYLAFVKDLKERAVDGKGISSEQIKLIHNMLEDGMIEERERAHRPESFKFFSASNRLFPRVGREEEAEEEVRVPAPEGYIPTDSEGNPLEIEDGQVVIPAGTKLSAWGPTPISLPHQAQAAILAESLPEFAPGELHPTVQDALDECRPHIDAAVRGNTADCVAQAYNVQAILNKHGLLRDDLTEEEWQQMQDMAGQMMDAPSPPPPGGQEGEGQGQMNPTPGPGSSMMGEALREKLEQNQKEQGSGEEGDGSDGSASDSGNTEGKSGESSPSPSQRADSGGKPDGQLGDESSGSGGYDKSAPLPEGSREKHDEEGRGRVDDGEMDDMLRDAQEEIDRRKSEQQADNSRAQRAGKTSASDWQLPGSASTVSQRDMRRNLSEQSALADEEGELSRLGYQLGAKLKRIKTKANTDKSMQRRGRLDSRRFSASMAGNPKGFKRPGQKIELDMTIDWVIDRSGSVSHEDSVNQLRMARMAAVAGKQADIPTSIYGYDGGYGDNAGHYAYKERHSKDTTSLDAILQTGGGGTPTGLAVEFSRARLARAKERNRVMVVVTDGGANDLEQTRAEVEAAKRQGITVLGLAFHCDEQMMDEQFGSGNWKAIENYTEAPRLVGGLIERAAKRVLSRR